MVEQGDEGLWGCDWYWCGLLQQSDCSDTGPKVRATGEHGRLERVGSSCRYKPADPLVAESPGNFSGEEDRQRTRAKDRSGQILKQIGDALYE